MLKMLICFIFIFSTEVFSKNYLNLSLIHKKGVNKGLILVSELHSLEEIYAGREIALEMKNGYMVKLFTGVQDQKILITGKFFNGSGAEGTEISKNGILVGYGEEKSIELKNSGDQLLLLRVLPRTL